MKNSSLPFGPKTLVLGAGALIAYGLTRRSKSGTALATAGSVLAFTAARNSNAPAEEETAVFLVNATPERAYGLWHNFENLPRFMRHLKSVTMQDQRRSEWVAEGPMGREVRWTAETTEDVPNKRISWRTLPGSDVDNSGSVEFRADPLGRGTYVTARIRYRLPGGTLAKAAATVSGKNPEFVVREDLRHFKSLLETGEVVTVLGQTHGPRGLHGATEQFLFREPINQPDPQIQPGLGRSA